MKILAPFQRTGTFGLFERKRGGLAIFLVLEIAFYNPAIRIYTILFYVTAKYE